MYPFKLTVVPRVFQYSYVQEGGLEPFQCNRYICDGIENDLRIQMLDEVMVKTDDNKSKTNQGCANQCSMGRGISNPCLLL